VSGVAVRAIGLVTGWGRGVAALPADARVAADGRAVITVQPTPRTSDRLRRATRECLLAVDAVDALLAEGALAREDIAGAETALVYVTAAAYGASNRAFVESGGGALHFPYTAPSAVPAEVAIEFGLHGPYAVLIGGAATTIDAITHAATLLARGACERAIVLAVETFTEFADLLARGGTTGDGPLVEAAAAALLVGGTANESTGGGLGGSVSCPPNSNPIGVGTHVSYRVSSDYIGETLACAPLIALARARARGHGVVGLAGRWRGREATTTVGVA
jgi:hypothetical protein